MALSVMSRQTIVSLGGGLAGRGAAALGGLVLSIIVARLTGPEGLGQFAFSLVTVTVLTMVARFGLDVCLLRTVARRITETRPEDVPALLFHVLKRVGAQAVALGLAAGLGALILDRATDLDLRVLAILALSAVPIALTAVVAAYLKACRRQALAALLEIGGLSVPVAAVLALLLALGQAPGLAAIAWMFTGLVWLMAALTVPWAIRNAKAMAPASHVQATVRTLDAAERDELQSGHIKIFTGSMAGFLTQAGSFMIVGLILAEEMLGLARAAERLTLLITFATLVINPFIAPRVVAHVTTRSYGALRRLMRQACLLSAGLALPVTLALMILPQTALALFGPGFDDAVVLLMIYAAGQFLVALTGPFAMCLSMSGHEGAVMRISLGLFAASIILLPLGALIFDVTGYVAIYAVLLAARGGAMFLAYRRALAGFRTAWAGHESAIRPE